MLPPQVLSEYAEPVWPTWMGLEHARAVLHLLRDYTLRLRFSAEACGLWPGEGVSLGHERSDREDTLFHALRVASLCGECYWFEGARALSRFTLPSKQIAPGVLGVTQWPHEATAVVRMLGASVSALARCWGIEGVEPGKDDVLPMRGGLRCWRWRPGTDPLDWLTPLPLAAAHTIARCLPRLDWVLTQIGPPEAGDLCITSPIQQEALGRLKGRALSGKELAAELDIEDTSQLCRDVTNPLQEAGRIKNSRKLGGYYRPDFPPAPELEQPRRRGRRQIGQ